MTLTENKDIIVVGQQSWDVSIGSNCKNIAMEFSKKNRVLFVNLPLDRISSIRDRKDIRTQKRLKIISGKEKGLIKIRENLWTLYPDCIVESVNWLPVDVIFDWVNKANAKKFVRSIQKALNVLNFQNYLLFNDNEVMKCFYLHKLLQPVKSIYYSRDYILATEYWKKHGKRLEPIVIAENDLCVANSTYLADYCKQYNPKSYYVGQGCELEIFQQGSCEKPKGLQNLESPVVGYVGALLSNRLDIEILLHIAQQRPKWSIILTGPEDEGFKRSALHEMTNVHFTGHKPAAELPAFINVFDVCINPQIVNELTIGNYPRKIDEYLAMGKPVVATNTKAMEIFEGHVYIAKTKEDYITLIEKALFEDTPPLKQIRKDFASAHTWENSVAEIYRHINMNN